MTKNKNGSKGLIIGLIALVVICGAGWLLNYYVMPKGEKGAKTIQVQVVHGDQSAKDLEYHTDAAYLGEVLKAEKLVEGEEGQYGMFITTVGREDSLNPARVMMEEDASARLLIPSAMMAILPEMAPTRILAAQRMTCLLYTSCQFCSEVKAILWTRRKMEKRPLRK